MVDRVGECLTMPFSDMIKQQYADSISVRENDCWHAEIREFRPDSTFVQYFNCPGSWSELPDFAARSSRSRPCLARITMAPTIVIIVGRMSSGTLTRLPETGASCSG